MSAFTPEEVAALRRLVTLFPHKPLCLIGASALRALVESYWRNTRDLDIAVSVGVADLGKDFERRAGFVRHPRKEHEWLAPGGVSIDILPASPDLVAAGELVWPESQHVMSLVGFRLVFDSASPVVVAPDLSIAVPALETIGLLKMVSFQDRPHERLRDLEDLSHLLQDFLAVEQRFDDDIIATGVAYEDASAYGFGRALATRVNAGEAAMVRSFLSRLRDENGSDLARMLSVAPLAWNKDPEVALARLSAFERGIESSPNSSATRRGARSSAAEPGRAR